VYRQVERNYELESHKHKIRENLLSDIGEYHRKKPTADVEPVFGHIKHNPDFKIFYHRGNEKVEFEFGLHALAHDLRKKSA
jgi:hypothetical protein